MSNYLPIAASAALMLAAGAFHGVKTDRWVNSPELRYAVEYLPRLPKAFSGWEGTDVAASEGERKQLFRVGARASLMRRYVSRESGEIVSILLMCGRPSPISAHTPEICYGGAGFAKTAPELRCKFEEGGGASSLGAFWAADFRRPDSVDTAGLRIYWSWRGARGWEAVDNPRLVYASVPALYKLYVIREIAVSGGSPTEDKVITQFVRDLLPELERSVFTGGELQPGVASAPDSRPDATAARRPPFKGGEDQDPLTDRPH